MTSKRFLVFLITCVFFGLAVFFLGKTLSDVHSHEVFMALKELPWTILLLSLLAVLLNYLILSSYDFLGLRHLGVKSLHWPLVFWSAFVAYVFNLNLGAWVGGVGMRFRIYARWKVPLEKIPQVMLFSIITNWMGYIFLLGLLFTFRTIEMGELISMKPSWIRAIGVSGLLLVSVYFGLSLKRFKIKFRKQIFTLPGPGTALLQLALASLQWCLLSVILTLLLLGLGRSVNFSDVLFTYLLASVAGVITHVPGGLGVLEAVFLEMGLGVDKAGLLVALICFRALYYLIPLLLGVPAYFMLEIYQKRQASFYHSESWTRLRPRS